MSVLAEVEVIRAACCVAGVDGQVHAREMAVLEQLAGRVGVGAVSLRAMVERARTDDDFYQDQFRLFRTEPERTINILFSVASRDGLIREEERIIIRHFADRLGLELAAFDRLLRAAEEAAARHGDAASG